MDRRLVMAVMTVAVVAGCAGDTTDPAGQPAGEPAALRAGAELADTVITGVVPFDDDYEHVIVTAASSPLAAVDLAPADPTMAAHAPTGLSGELTVRSGTEQRTVVFTDGQLEAVAATPTEQVRIDEALDVGMIALVVVDVAGVAGEAGERYLSLDGELVALDPNGVTATPAAAVIAPDAVERADEEILADIESLGGVMAVEVVAPGLFSVSTDGEVPELADVPGVASVAPDTLLGLTEEPEQWRQWAIANTGDSAQSLGYPSTAGFDTGAPYAWDVASGDGVVVAVIDSGVQLDHPDLAARLELNAADPCGDGRDDDANGFVDDCRGWDVGARDNDPSPSTSDRSAYHGTHVAGIIAADRNGVGVVGIAPGATILPIKVSSDTGSITASSLVAALQYATDRGADVINLSLSTPPDTSRAAVATIESAVRYAGERGVVIVAAAGNDGVNTTTAPAWPSSFSDIYPYVIGVGATTTAGQRASFSNYGTAVDVSGPGQYIYATMPGGGYGHLSGTSMAAPAVAGAAAVVLSQQDRAPADVRQRLVDTAMASAAGPSLDVAAAVGATRDRTWTVTYRDVTGLAADASGGFVIDVRGRMPGATALRVSVATLDQGEVAAVGGVTASFAGPAGTVAATTDDGGAFAPFEIAGDLEVGLTFDVSGLALPAGRYALVNELVTGMGATVGELQAVFLTVGESGSSVSTTVPMSVPLSVPTSSPTSVPTTGPVATTSPTPGTPAPGTTQPSVGTTTPASPVGGGGNGGGNAVTTTSVAGGGGGGGGVGTTIPSRPSGGGGTTVTTVAGSPTTTPPASPVSTTVPSTGTSTTVAPNTMPVTTVPAPTATTTTPPPAPDSSGDWAVTGMEPRLGPVSGGTAIVITGRFPTWVPVYVWFGESGIVRATSYGDRLELEAPAAASSAVVDVSIRFRTSSDHELTLSRAFTYVAPQPPSGGAGGGTTGGTVTTTQPNQVATTTVATAPPTTRPAATTVPAATTTTVPNATTTTPAIASTTTMVASGGGSGGGSTWTRQRGALTLRPVSPGSSLSGLTASRWPSGSCSSTCTGTTF